MTFCDRLSWDFRHKKNPWPRPLKAVAQGQEAKVYGPAAVPVEKTRKIRPLAAPMDGYDIPRNYYWIYSNLWILYDILVSRDIITYCI